MLKLSTNNTILISPCPMKIIHFLKSSKNRLLFVSKFSLDNAFMEQLIYELSR